MNLLNLLSWKKYSKFRHLVSDMRSFLQTQEARNEIVKSIAYSENPLFLTEYVFEVDKGVCVSKNENSFKQNIPLLENIFNEGLDKYEKEYLSAINSAHVIHSPKKNPIFHTHPRVDYKTCFNKLNFSDEDIEFAKVNPLGLIEYCVSPKTNKTIDLTTAISIRYKKHEKLLSQIKFSFYPDGSYSSCDGKVHKDGWLSDMLYMPKEMVDRLSFLDDPFTNHIFSHTIKVLYSEKKNN